jgi:GTP cyclohydrolase II
MFHRTHQNDALLTEGVSASDAMDALLHDLAQARARKRPEGRPFVTLAYAQSVDGSISIARGQRSALSGPESLRLTHALRAGHDGILVGVGTVVADDPELRVRLVDGRDPQPVIVDSQLSTPVAARLLAQKGRRPWIGTTTRACGPAAAPSLARPDHAGDLRGDAHDRRARIEARGARILQSVPQANGWVDLPALLHQLHAEGISHLMVEGGARIITSFLEARLVDYVAITIAPVFMGGLSAVGQLSVLTPAPAATRGAPATAAPPLGPALSRWVSARLGHDLVMAGEVSWPAT